MHTGQNIRGGLKHFRERNEEGRVGGKRSRANSSPTLECVGLGDELGRKRTLIYQRGENSGHHVKL